MDTQVKRAVVVTALSLSLLALTAGIAMGNVTTTDDFEDGDTVGWSTGTVTTTNVYQGTYAYQGSGTWTAAPTVNKDDSSGQFLYRADNSENEVVIPVTGAQILMTSSAAIGLDVQNDGVFRQDIETNIDDGRWYWIEWELYGGGGMRAKAWPANGTEPTSWEANVTGSGLTDAEFDTGNNNVVIDDVTLNTAPTGARLDGNVTDGEGEPIESATVEATNGSRTYSTVTNADGSYTLALEPDNWTVTAGKPNYINQSKEVQLNQSESKILNFELRAINQSLRFNAPAYMQHGDRAGYELLVLKNGTDQRFTNVTEVANVTSLDTDVVTVDNGTNELVATSNRSVNSKANLTVQWTNDDGQTLTTTHTVTVANQTVNNLDVLPAVNSFAAIIGGGTDSDRGDRSFLVILIATGVGAAAALIATSLAGVAIIPLVCTAGWLAGYAQVQIAIASALVALFVGMNIAANIDYGSIRTR